MASYAKSAQTKEHILKSALVLFRDKGYHATSLKDIAEAAGVSTGTLYRYFPSKGDLLFQIRRRTLDNLHQVAANLPSNLPLVDKLCHIVAADVSVAGEGIDLRFYSDHRNTRTELALAIQYETYASTERLAKEEEFRQELRSIYRAIIEGEQDEERFDPTVDAAILSETASALYFQAIDQSILEGGIDVAETLRPKFEVLFRQAR